MSFSKPKVRIERVGDGHVVKEYGPGNCCAVELYRGDIDECQDFAQGYVREDHMTSKTITLYLAVNQDGDVYTGTESFDDAIGELQGGHTCEAIRTVRLEVTVELPVTETVVIPPRAPLSATQVTAQVS